jgi:hypothetical protein
MGKPDKYRVIRKVINGHTNYLLQELRTDASQPYYLTQRVFYVPNRANTALKSVMTTGKLP